ncbi:MAG: porin, partial [Gallionella sp.]
MQKKLIALAIATAMTVPALAYAEATVYGQARLSIDNFNDGVVAASASAWQLNSNASRLGFKGSEDLGNGLSAVWQMEATVAMDTGTGQDPPHATTAFFDRNTYLGVKSNDFGTVLVGRHDTPYKMSTRNLDLFADTAGDNRSGNGLGGVGNSGLMSAHDVRLGNVIAYVSPGISGFSIAAAGIFGGEDPLADSTKGTGYSLNGTWKSDSFYAALAYQSIKFGTPLTGDLGAGSDLATCDSATTVCFDDTTSSFKLGGGWTMDAFTVNAIVEMPSYKVG